MDTTGKAAEGIGGSQSRSGKDQRAELRVRQLAANWFPGLDVDLVDRLCADAWRRARSQAPDRPIDAVAALAATSVRRAGLSAMRGEPATPSAPVDAPLATALPAPKPTAVPPEPERVPAAAEPVASERESVAPEPEPATPEPAQAREAPVARVWTLAPVPEHEPAPQPTAGSAPLPASAAPARSDAGTPATPADRLRRAPFSAGGRHSVGGRPALFVVAGLTLFGIVATALGSSDDNERRAAAPPAATRSAPALPSVPAGPAPETQRPTASAEPVKPATKRKPAAKRKSAAKRKRAAKKRSARRAKRSAAARKRRSARLPASPAPRRVIPARSVTPAAPQRVQPAAPAPARAAPTRRSPSPASGSEPQWGNEFAP